MRLGRHRPGITLLEVLAAIFIMGVGMLAILTLFPLGALNMARALRDDRAGHIAYAADSLALARDLATDPSIEPFLRSQPVGPPAPNPHPLPPDPNGLGYPVFVDPHFRENGGATFSVFSTAAANAGIQPAVPLARVSPSWLPGPNATYLLNRYFMLQDDLTYEPDGRPKMAGGLERQGHYTWSYMLRRTVSSNPATTERYVLVYSGRPVLVPDQEKHYDLVGTGAPGATAIILDGTGPNGLPALKRGSWLFDISYYPSASNASFGRVNGNFYRVLSATKVGATQVQVELEPPLQNEAQYPMRRVVDLENVVEVFDRGTRR